MNRLRNDHHTALQVPTKHHLRRGLAMSLADFNQHGVLEQPAATLAEGSPGFRHDAVLGLPFLQLDILVQRMALHLVHHRLRFVELAELHHAVNVKVRDADCAHLAFLIELHHIAPRAEHIAERLVEQQQVDVVGLQLAQRILDRRARGALAEMLDPHLGGKEDIAAVDARGSDGRAHLLFVEIALRRIDMAIPYLERVAHAALALVLRHLVHAVAQLGHLHAVRKRHVHHVVCHIDSFLAYRERRLLTTAPLLY